MALTIENWLAGKVDYDVPELTIAGILEDNGINEGEYVAELSQRQKDLALADLYSWVATSSTSSSGEYESDGGWQKQKSAKNVVNRAWFQAEAARLRRKWGAEVPSGTAIVMRNLY